MHVPIIFFVGKEGFLIIVDEIMRKSYSTYPREVIDDAFLLKDTYHENRGSAEAEGKAYLTMHPFFFYFISTALYILVVFLSCVITDLVFVFGFVGSFWGTYIIFIGPASFYLKSIEIEGVKVSKIKTLSAWIFMIIGILIFVIWLSSTIFTAVMIN